MRNETILKAAQIVGSQTALAKALGVSLGAVNQWATYRRPVPAEYCPSIERLTNGAVRCEDLLPTIDWQYLRATDCPTNKEAA